MAVAGSLPLDRPPPTVAAIDRPPWTVLGARWSFDGRRATEAEGYRIEPRLGETRRTASDGRRKLRRVVSLVMNYGRLTSSTLRWRRLTLELSPIHEMSAIPENEPSVLIVDDNESFAISLAGSFRRLGWDVCLARDYAQVKPAYAARPPGLVVAELRIGVEWAFRFVDHLRVSPGCKLTIATQYPSVATAVRALRLGFDGYFAKPVHAGDIVEALSDLHLRTEPRESAPDDPTDIPTLNRTIWEYLNHVLVAAGTMTEAARRLGIDRRSLRRMLARHPPAR
jgi:two-component system response regulator RegA